MPQLFKFHDAQILCVKVKSHSNAKDTRAELIKKFSKTSKSIRQGKNRNQFQVEFENPETMEANEKALESLKVNGEKVIVINFKKNSIYDK